MPPMRERWKRVVRMAGGLALAITAAVAMPSADPPGASAQAGPEASLSLVPGALKVPWEGEVPAAILLSNPTDFPVRVTIETPTLTGAVVRLVAPTAGADGPSFGKAHVVPAKASLRWDLTVRRDAAGALGSRLLARATIEAVDAAGNPGSPVRRPVAVADISPADAQDLDSVASVEVKAALTRIDDLRGGSVFVVVRNRSAGTVTVTDVVARALAHIAVDPAVKTGAGALPLEIAPGETHAVEFRVQGQRQVQVGKELLVFDVLLRWGNPGAERTGRLIASHPVEVGVFGDSELATILQVPLLVVPGLLALGAMAILWRSGVRWGRKPGPDFPFVARSAEFWFVALAASAAALIVYDALRMGYYRLWQPGDVLNDWRENGFSSLLTVYGSADILGIVLVAAAAGAAVAFTLSRLTRRRARRYDIPTQGQPNLALLRCLGRRHRTVRVERGMQKRGTSTRPVLILGQDWAGTSYYVSTEVVLTLPNLDAATAGLEAAVVAALDDEERGMQRLVDLLDGTGATYRLSWRGAGGMESVQLVTKELVEPQGEHAPLIVLGV